MKTFLIAALTAWFAAGGSAQLPSAAKAGGANSGEIKWERYRTTSGERVAVMFPKMPILIRRETVCEQQTKESYYAAAEQVVYELTVVSKSKQDMRVCLTPKRFGSDSLEARLSEIRSRSLKSESPIGDGNQTGTLFRKDLESRWVLNDLENDRWIELAVHRKPDVPANEERFVDSLDLGGQSGVEIGRGAESLIGDADIKAAAVSEPSTGAEVKDNLSIVARQPPSYTASARQAKVTGKVVLRVAFEANGGIGEITPVETLSHGLTESAIAAARKIVFLPARLNGAPITVVRPVEFSFSIY